MAQFAYIAKEKDGRSVRGDVEASDKSQAIGMLRSKDLLVLKLEEVKTSKMSFSLSKLMGGESVKMDDLVIMTRQLATMIESGIPVVGSLDILAEQADNEKLKSTLIDVRDAVNTGSNLSDALGRHKRVFSDLFVNMVKAGESSGKLDSILERIATYMEKSNNLQKKIKAALIYPAVVTGMAVVITLVMILKVIPVFKNIFSGFGAELPGPTQFLINVSDLMTKYFYLFIIALIGLVILVKRYINTPDGKKKVDAAQLKMPIFGIILRKVAISKFTRTLSTLIQSGVPILGALDIVSKTSGNVMVEMAVENVRNSVKEGEDIATPLARSGIFPTMVTRMVAVGEKSGELEKMLTKISDFYDEQVDIAVDALTSLIEPVIIAFLGIVIGGIVLCMFLPIFKISTIVNF